MADSMGTVYKDLKPFLALGQRYRLEFGVGHLLSLATLMASVGLLALSGWFITATAVAGLTVATAQAFNFFTPGAGVRGFSIARTAGRYGERLVTHNATFKLLAGLRVWFFEKVQPLAPAGLQRFRQSELLNRLVADIDTLDGLYLRLISPLLLAVTGSIALVVLAFLFSVGTGWFLLVMFSGMVLILPGWFFRLGQEPGEQIVQEREVLRSRLMDFVAGQTELQVYGATARYHSGITKAEQKGMAQEQRMAGVTGLAALVIAGLTGITLAGVLYLHAQGLGDAANAGYLQGPVAAMLVLATLAGFEAVMPLPAAFQMLGQTHQAAQRLRDVTEQKPLVAFPEAGDMPELAFGQLSIEKIHFGYAGQSVLNNVSLDIQMGERVALVGPTGCGKSTLLQLITRDWPIAQGSITLDGMPLSCYSESELRRRMVVMPQRVHIFSATLRDNLLLAVHPDCDQDFSDEELLEVLESVGLSHIAPEKELLDTWMGAAGQALSGGEQRRLGIARVLLKLRDGQCALVLLDEPTEGLDPETEGRMISVLNEALPGKTLLMVTHRPAVLELVERVVRL